MSQTNNSLNHSLQHHHFLPCHLVVIKSDDEIYSTAKVANVHAVFVGISQLNSLYRLSKFIDDGVVAVVA